MQEEAVHELLRDMVTETADRNEAAQHEPGMQGQELEPAVEPVRRGQRLVQGGPAGCGHDLAAKLLDEDFAGAPGAPSGENHRNAP